MTFTDYYGNPLTKETPTNAATLIGAKDRHRWSFPRWVAASAMTEVTAPFDVEIRVGKILRAESFEEAM